MLLLQGTIFAGLIITIRCQFDLSQYQCTSDNSAQCDLLQTQYGSVLSTLASGSVFTCNNEEEICSLTCTSDSTCEALASFGVNGLTCDMAHGYCTTDLSCTNSSDCILTGFSTCASPPGVCIPDSSNVCATANDCAVGLKNCETQTVQGKNVTLCSPEPCDNSTACISDGYICDSNNICVSPCTTDSNCDPGIGTPYSSGATCNLNTGLCVMARNETDECDDTFFEFDPIENGTCGICFCDNDYNEECVGDIAELVKSGKTNKFMTECSFTGTCEIDEIDIVDGYESMKCGCEIYQCNTTSNDNGKGSKDSNRNAMSMGMLIGIICVGVCFLICVIILGVYCCKKRSNTNQFGFKEYEVNNQYQTLNDGQSEIQL